MRAPILVTLLLAAAPARADAVSEILDQLKARIDTVEKLAAARPSAATRAQLKKALRALRNDVDRAQRVLATPTVPPPPPMPPPPPAPPPSMRVTLSGRVNLQSRCTRMACGPERPCCNQCSLTVRLTPDDGPYARREILVENGHGCSIDGCGKVSGCALKDGDPARFAEMVVTCPPGEECVARK